ncbi:MAG: 50S ribosomal protein L2 [archaeon]
MGKNLIQQARGKGGPTYRAPSFRFKGAAKVQHAFETMKVLDLVLCQGHSAPLAFVQYGDGSRGYVIAGEGIRVGDELGSAQTETVQTGTVLCLRDIPEGTAIFNIEATPGDGGRFVRASGTTARITNKTPKQVTVKLTSGKFKTFNPNCRATIGVVAGGGRKAKPFLKAGRAFHHKKKKNRLYPIMSGSAQNAVDHPFGNKRTSRKSKARPAPHNAPPGRNVGYIRPRQTGQKKGRAQV